MKNECSIIRDILPLYVENMVSEDTSEFVKEHLESCPACRAELEKLREPVEVQTEPQPDMDAAPLKRLKKALLMKKVQTILCTAAVLLALTATPLVWASRQSAAYRRYMDALNGSVLYAREHDGVWLERAGSRVHYPQLAGAGISEKLRQAGMGKRQQELPEGEGVTLDFGDGSLLRLWEVPIRGGYTPEETFGVFVAYTYPDGETYCYDTDNLGWDRVVDSLPSAG